MQPKRIIPCLDIKDGRIVKGVNFTNLIDAGDPVEVAQRYNQMGADEIVFLNIDATEKGTDKLYKIIDKVVGKIDIPIIVGGGVVTIENAVSLIQRGISKISVGSAAVKTPSLIEQIASKFGSKKVIVAIDVKKTSQQHYEVYINGGRTNTKLEAVQWARKCQDFGAGEILLTSMNRDGTKDGYDIEIINKVSSTLNIPVIASGGAGTKEHFKEVLSTKGKASAALAASLFHFNQLGIMELKRYLRKSGILVNIKENNNEV